MANSTNQSVMFGIFRDNHCCTGWPLRVIAIGGLGICISLAGCNQNSPSGAYNPFGQPTGAAASPNSQQYMNDMRMQAQRQYEMAMEQQRRLAELESMQRQSEQQLAAVRDQERQAKLKTIEQKQAEDALLAQRAREFLGRYDDLGLRANNLDRNNQDLHARVAKVQQRAQLVEDQNQLLRQRLQDTSKQLASALEANKRSEQRLKTVSTTVPRRSGATITANNSYRRALTAVTVSGLSIRQDGELVRIELSSDALFQPESATLRPDASTQLDQVANVVVTHYPRQVVGVEAHTDRAPTNTATWRNAHQLTAAQATAVFEQLSRGRRLLPQQMFVLGHGANFALASNGTDAGRLRNRRIEIVIYPDTVGHR